MPRTVVPRAEVSPGSRAASGRQGDAFPSKLVKYVPAEVLAFFVPTAAAVGDTDKAWAVVLLVLGAVGAFLYSWIQGSRTDKDAQPGGHFYALSVVAFVVWAVGTTHVLYSSILGMSDTGAGLVLAIGVFAIPLVDEVIDTMRSRHVSPPFSATTR